MFGERLRQLRLARGFTLEALAARMGGLVTKQALSKYEGAKSFPSSVVLMKLASALEVKPDRLLSDPTVSVEFVAYRKGSKLGKREQEHAESLAKEGLQERVRLQGLTGQFNGSHLPVHTLVVKRLEDVETRATDLRARWNLGLDPIASVVDVLEEHFVHVLEIDAKEGFEGISAVAFDEGRNVAAAAVVTRRGVPGERQRLNLAHEVGHLVLKVPAAVEEERAAFRFGGAFLAPAEIIRNQVGTRRSSIQLRELFLLRDRFGMSMQALLYRFRDLDIISESHYRSWCRNMSILGWRKKEPEESQPERPRWLQRTVVRALAEDLITQEDAERILGERVQIELPLSRIERRAFMKLPLEERRRILAEQAARAAAAWEEDYADWRKIEGGDIAEY